MIESGFIAWNFISGVRKDLDKSLIELGGEIADLHKYLEGLKQEQSYLRLLVAYTEMLEKGSQYRSGKCLDIVRRALATDEVMEGIQDIRDKVDTWKKKCSEELAGHVPESCEESEIPEGDPEDLEEDEDEDLEEDEDEDLEEVYEKIVPKAATDIPDEVHLNLIRWARENDDKSISDLCSSGKYKLDNLAYYAAWTEAKEAKATDSLKALDYWFGDLIDEDRKDSELPWRVDPEFGESGENTSEKFSMFSAAQVHEAAMEAARIWGKTSDKSGKFSLRVFIDILESKVGPEADIDVELAEYVLNECPSVIHCVGDVWMEVN